MDKPKRELLCQECGREYPVWYTENSLWKTYAHAVVYKNGKCVYDPQYPSKWKDNRITHRLHVIKSV